MADKNIILSIISSLHWNSSWYNAERIEKSLWRLIVFQTFSKLDNHVWKSDSFYPILLRYASEHRSSYNGGIGSHCVDKTFVEARSIVKSRRIRMRSTWLKRFIQLHVAMQCLTKLPLPYAVFERLFSTDASFRSGEILELTAGLNQVQ